MDSRFRCADRFLVRAPLLPRRRIRAAAPGRAGMLERLGSALLREAVTLASPSLGAAVDKVLAGRELSESATLRLHRALTRYELRMAGRPTPFGLLAGVAVGGFADRADAVLGGAHRRHVRPDRAWVAEWLDEVEADTQFLFHLHVVANNMCARHGDRFTVPNGRRLSSVRATVVVVHVLNNATRPVQVAELVDSVVTEFPGVTRSGVVALVAQLLRLRFLQSTLRQLEDPLAYVATAFAEESAHGKQAAVIKELIDVYQRTPIGAGIAELAALRRAAGADAVIQIDLALDARVRLPRSVAHEVERAADALWRLSARDNARSRNLDAFHRRFLERYGMGELVPVLDLLDPDVGIGLPAGYERAWSVGDRDESRQPVLNRLLVRAMADGVREVVLDDDLISELSPPGGSPPDTVELFVTVRAVSAEALDRGDFELVVSPVTGTQQAGASLGRFGHLPAVGELLRALVSVQGDDRMPVQLAHSTTRPKDANVTQVPRVLSHVLAVGLPVDACQPGNLRLTDIAVAADAHGLRLYSVSLGREIVPRVLHVLDISSAAPDMVRFLWDVSLMGVRTLKPWDWAALSDAPFLPAIRYGRTVLSPARWLATSDDLGTDEALAAWQSRWRVPERVRLTNLDQQLCLHLDMADHRALLRDEVRRSGTAALYEDRAPELAEGWLRGPEGTHEAELVVPLIAVSPPARPTRHPAPLRTRSMARTPGGEWVSAHIQCSPHRQREVLVGHLRPWLETLSSEVDRWFFVRYQTEDQSPHIRLRLHGQVLPQLRDQVAKLSAARLVGDFSLHTYHPEVERYGGEQLIGLAEPFFTADSRLALRRLSAPPDSVAVAADLVTLVSLFHGDGWPSWLLHAVPKNETTHKAFVRRRADALAAITLDPVAADQDWAELLTRYGREARTLAAKQSWLSPDEILRALLHMHCNRRLGANSSAEAETYAMARGAVQAHVGRRRVAR